jgi:hypothetical protein
MTGHARQPVLQRLPRQQSVARGPAIVRKKSVWVWISPPLPDSKMDSISLVDS